MQIADLDAIFTSELLQSINSEYVGSVKGGGVWAVVAGTDHAAFVEFGTGVVGKQSPYKGNLPEGVDWQYASGKTIRQYSYNFPESIQLTKRIRDYQEEVIDDKFYVSDKALKGFVEHAKKQKEKGNTFHAVIKDVDDIASTISARYYKDGSDCLIKVAGRINSSQDGKVVYTDGIAPTLTADHYNVPKIADTAMRKLYESVKLQHIIRKLTPRECGRLMGVSDEDISKMAAVNSNTQLYKQFGNSIVVDVMCAMFKNLNIEQVSETRN